jgi:hypothetical protein
MSDAELMHDLATIKVKLKSILEHKEKANDVDNIYTDEFSAIYHAQLLLQNAIEIIQRRDA